MVLKWMCGRVGLWKVEEEEEGTAVYEVRFREKEQLKVEGID